MIALEKKEPSRGPKVSKETLDYIEMCTYVLGESSNSLY